MPRAAARIFLRVTGVRAERLQDITARDCVAEGMNVSKQGNVKHDFAKLWGDLNTQRGYSWESNPWVWVVEFERMDRDARPF